MPTYEYPRPALTADIVVVRRAPCGREVLLVKRLAEPFVGRWALPGGFVDEWESVEAAARRELAEETALVWEGPLTLIGMFDEPGRDPRGWTVTVAFFADVSEWHGEVRAGDDAGEVGWFDVDTVPRLGFDHDDILAAAVTMDQGLPEEVP